VPGDLLEGAGVDDGDRVAGGERHVQLAAIGAQREPGGPVLPGDRLLDAGAEVGDHDAVGRRPAADEDLIVPRVDDEVAVRRQAERRVGAGRPDPGTHRRHDTRDRRDHRRRDCKNPISRRFHLSSPVSVSRRGRLTTATDKTHSNKKR
jgi:hypothetical protein